MNIYNVLFVSNSISYAEEFKRIAQFNSVINLVGIARGLHDFRMKMQSNNNIHVVLVSDVLSDGTLQDVMNELVNYDAIVFGILKDGSNGPFLESYGVSATTEKEMNPADVVDFLAQNLTDFPVEEGQEFEQTPQEEIEPFVSRFEENAPQYNEYSQNNQPTYQNRESQYDRIDRNMRNTEASEPPQKYNSSRRATTMGVLKPKIVCMTSAKGGVGKSALAIEIAACIAARGKEVEVNMSTMRGSQSEVKAVLVDLNCAFGTIASTLPCVSDMKNPPTLADWIIKIRDKIMRQLSSEDKRELQAMEQPRYAPYIYKINRNALSFTKDEVMSLLVKEPKSGLYVLPTISSNYDIFSIESEFIEIIIEELHNFFDVVMLDTGNNFEDFTQTAFRMSNEIYIVAQPNFQVTVIIRNLLRDSIEGLGIDKSKFRLIINHPQTNKQVISDEAMQKALDIPYAGGINHDENMLLAHDEGKFYVINNKKKPISRAITLIANQICPLWNVANAPKKGIFEKLFGK